MRDVREGASVHERRRMLERLHEVGFDGVLEQRCHGALGMQVGCGNGLATIGVCDHHAPQARLKVHKAAREAERRHDLRGHGDVKAVLAGDTLCLSAKTVHDVAQLAIVHIDRALPHDLLWIDAKGVTLLDVVIEHGGKEVVGSTDGVEVAREMQVDILHGNHLGIAAARRTALDAEDRPERGLAQRQHRLLAQSREGVRQTNGGRGLALARRRGVDRRHKHELGLTGQVAQSVDIDLRLVRTIMLELLVGKADRLGDPRDGPHLGFLGNLDIGLVLCHAVPSQQACRAPGEAPI